MEYGLGKVEESVELWFSDNQTDHVKVSVKVEKQLFDCILITAENADKLDNFVYTE